jgi:hypothetical protein
MNLQEITVLILAIVTFILNIRVSILSDKLNEADKKIEVLSAQVNKVECNKDK